MTPQERFMDKVSPEPNSGCWLWTGYTLKGYGRFGAGGRSAGVVYAHRFSYEMHKGIIPVGLEIDHTCNVKSCVNPDHLEAVTHQENIQRMVDRGGGRWRGYTSESWWWKKNNTGKENKL